MKKEPKYKENGKGGGGGGVKTRCRFYSSTKK